MLTMNEAQKLTKKYNLSSKDVAMAEVIILDGIVLKDRHNPSHIQGQCSLIYSQGQTKKIIIGCQTEYGDLRVYRNFNSI